MSTDRDHVMVVVNGFATVEFLVADLPLDCFEYLCGINELNVFESHETVVADYVVAVGRVDSVD